MCVLDLLHLSQQIGVACYPPSPIRIFAQYRERVTGAAHGCSADRRHDNLKIIPKIGPFA